MVLNNNGQRPQRRPLLKLESDVAAAIEEHVKKNEIVRTPECKAYQDQVLRNCSKFPESLLAKGYDLVSEGTENHLVLVNPTNKIRVELPDAYPFKSQFVGFITKIYHPNVDELSGSVCLYVINQRWSPIFDLVNVFETFLPQLLLYLNRSDPLNGEVVALVMHDCPAYE
ncbi:hypothetical protein AALP_AA5G133400 [Arabis alpina]|uniref:UBC core domain-containing protein n=1 Tax=Arabis alpina TaxID=50452 RepID=A0A087GWU4_ARAAL|nr:hypothetical protein AALP_AA5G133400 [Arabis alpina]